jgi:acetyltransferase-like isoleucine patch superfamily enzyme/acyl carrier protein
MNDSPPAWQRLLQKSPLASQLFEKVTRDREKLPGYVLRRKAMTYLESLALSPLYLRHCTKLGKRARTRGMPFIENLGRIEIGDDFNFVSLFVRSHLVTGHSGFLEIGNSVNINFGAAISAHEHVKIGDRVRMGPYAIVMDSDYHAARDRGERPTAPIIIEEDVWLAGRVSVLRGSHIGRGSVITAGSVVSGEIPAGVIAGGVPARVIRRIDGTDRAFVDWSPPPANDTAGSAARGAANATDSAAGVPRGATVAIAVPRAATVIATSDSIHTAVTTPPSAPTAVNGDATPRDDLDERVQALVAATFSLEGTVDPSWGPKEIPKWDSLGQLRLTFSLEETFKINISETQLTEMTTVDSVCRVVRHCLTSAG